MKKLDRPAVERLLRDHNIQATQQRLHIASIIKCRDQHLSADQVMAEVNRDGQLASKATIYNTLGLFCRKGLIRPVTVDPSRVFYDSNTQPHHHFYDLDTGELIDIPAEQVDIAQLPSLPEGATVEEVDVVIKIRGHVGG